MPVPVVPTQQQTTFDGGSLDLVRIRLADGHGGLGADGSLVSAVPTVNSGFVYVLSDRRWMGGHELTIINFGGRVHHFW